MQLILWTVVAIFAYTATTMLDLWDTPIPYVVAPVVALLHKWIERLIKIAGEQALSWSTINALLHLATMMGGIVLLVGFGFPLEGVAISALLFGLIGLTLIGLGVRRGTIRFGQ